MKIQDSVREIEAAMLCTDPPVVVDAELPLRRVILRMREARAGCALVVRNGKLDGIFTERDLLTKVLGDHRALEDAVAVYMTADPDSVSDRDSIIRAVAYMQRGGFRNVPVVDAAGAVVGCVRHKDIIAYLVEHFADRTLNLPPNPDQVTKSQDGA